MAVEGRRGCGYRKVGGLYLVCRPIGFSCDRFPISITTCPCCGQGIKPSRGWTWVFPHNLFSGDHSPCACPPICPVCHPARMGRRAGLVWIGSRYYSPESFSKEAAEMGVSKRIAAVPKGLVLGKTWVLVGHREAAQRPTKQKGLNGECITEPGPGIFFAFRPTRIEMICKESQKEDADFLNSLERRKITPVFVPDHDKDHV